MNKNEQDQFGTKSSAQDAASDLDGLSLPLSPAQLGVYFDHLNDATGIRYNLSGKSQRLPGIWMLSCFGVQRRD